MDVIAEELGNFDREALQSNINSTHQNIVEIIIYETNILWQKINAMLVANSLVLAFLVLVIQSKATPLIFIGVFLGFALCSMWELLNKRSLAYIELWHKIAHEFEEKFLPPSFHIISRASQFRIGKELKFHINGKPERFQATKSERLARAKRFTRVLAIAFAIMYVAILGIQIYLMMND